MPEEIRALVKAGPGVGKFTGERIARTRPRIYRKVVHLLSAEVPVAEIARICRVAPASVEAIRRANADTIGERKQSLAALASRIAHGAGETIENDIAAGKIRGSAAVVAFGVATDKLLLLSDQPTARVAVDINVVHDLHADFVSLTEEIKRAVVVQPPTITLEDSPPAS